MLTALGVLEKVAINQADFTRAVLFAGYGASRGKIDYEYNKIQRVRENKMWRRQESEERTRRLKNYIFQMKHDGLIEEAEKDKFRITKKGRAKLEKLKTGLPSRRYPQAQSCQNLAIISFDIPEEFHSKRDWLREVVKNMGFNMIHQSLWVGKRKIPESFVSDLENMKILEYVEIFEVTKSGTLRKLPA